MHFSNGTKATSSNERKLRGRRFALTVLLAIASFSGAANATMVTHTDNFGITWTLSSNGVNHGTTANPIYDVTILADTSGFSTDSNGVHFTNSNAYINDIAILDNIAPDSGVTLGPGDFLDTSLWTNVLGGQNSNGCNGNGADFDCAYSSGGGNNPPTGPGVLMNTTQTNPDLGQAGLLEWKFAMGFASGTTADQALNFASKGSHLKVDYYGYGTDKNYDFIGQISDDVTINHTIPDPPSISLLVIGLAGLRFLQHRNIKSTP